MLSSLCGRQQASLSDYRYSFTATAALTHRRRYCPLQHANSCQRTLQRRARNALLFYSSLKENFKGGIRRRGPLDHEEAQTRGLLDKEQGDARRNFAHRIGLLDASRVAAKEATLKLLEEMLSTQLRLKRAKGPSKDRCVFEGRSHELHDDCLSINAVIEAKTNRYKSNFVSNPNALMGDTGK